MTRTIADVRREYSRESLDESDVARDPVEQFARWFDEALKSELTEPTAVALATASTATHGFARPSARMVLLKGFDARGFVFFTNYESRKGKELAANPFASLVFFWAELERQVRVEGRVERVSAQASDEYYASRPLGARLSAWASAQSAKVPDRRALEDALAAMSARFGEHPPRPTHWGGYRVIPAAIEFWQGRANRLHDRLLYTPADGGWKIERLAP
jgi:pyridoxamine 5'-phosphate oxidase